MQRSYKGHFIIIAVANDPANNPKWSATCTILAPGSMRQLEKFRWELEYDTHQEAEQVGWLVSKKIIDQMPSSFSQLPGILLKLIALSYMTKIG